MRRIVASETLTVAVLVVLFAGDFFRNLLTVPGWVALALACTAWAIAALVIERVSWRTLPVTLLLLLGWIAVSPLWSPYSLTSAVLTLGFFFTVCMGVALASLVPFDQLVNRVATALRLILGASLLFEIAVATSGKPLYPVGMSAPPGTSIELAWSRGLFFVEGGRIQGIVGNANLLGMLTLLLLLITLVRIAKGQRTALTGVDAVLALVLLYKTASTTVFLAALAVAGVWALAWLARRPHRVARVAIGALLASAVGAIVIAITQWTTVASVLGKSPDMTNRFGIWEAVLERINVRPITGFGFVGWWPTWEGWFGLHAIRNIRVQQAHNVWLDLAMQVGLVGVALFAAVLLSTCWVLWRRVARSSDPAAIIAVGFMTAMTVQTLTESRILSEWGIALLVILAITARRDSLAPSREEAPTT
jgi:O-antigen ligase